jgi:hypothetical protein
VEPHGELCRSAYPNGVIALPRRLEHPSRGGIWLWTVGGRASLPFSRARGEVGQPRGGWDGLLNPGLGEEGARCPRKIRTPSSTPFPGDALPVLARRLRCSRCTTRGCAR